MRKDGCKFVRHAAIAFLMFDFEFLIRVPAAEIDLSRLPPPAQTQVDFDHDIKPIFQAVCWRCHGPEKPKSHFRLDNRASALKGGNDNTDDIVPGDSAHSKLIQYIARLVPDMEMPPPDKGEPLTTAQVALFRAWINQGASWGTTNLVPQSAYSFSPALRWASVQGDAAKFRELQGMKEGWGGGLNSFSLEQQNGPDEKFTAEGHALFPDTDYEVKLALTRTDVGFVRAGFDRWRKYYDDHGGFAPLLPTNILSLDRDLHLDIGRAWMDLGLTRPNLPQVVLGYEYQFRNGEKSMLEWGAVGTQPPFAPGTDSKNIYPNFKYIDEHTHILKLNLSYEVLGWHLEDNARAEFYQLDTLRDDTLVGSFAPAPLQVARIGEHDEHTQGVNTFSVSKQLTDWWSVSSGYFYSHLDGSASYQQNTVDGSGALASGDQWSANNIVLKRESQLASVGSLLLPWPALSLSTGVQGEWTQQEGFGLEDLAFGNPAIPGAFFPSVTNVLGRLDDTSARENVALRFTQIPYTVLFAEARLQQESLGRFEEGQEDTQPFIRDTDADIQSEEYRAGFNTSPWSRLSLGGSFRHSEKKTDYLNAVTNLSDFAYPGFFLSRDIKVNEANARVVLRPAPWLRTTWNYKWMETEFDNVTGIPFDSPVGGPIGAGRQRAQVYSFDAGLTPVRRLYLSGTFSYSPTRTSTAQNGVDYLVPYRGDIYSVLSSATFALSENADLSASYAYSKADYRQDNLAAGLPAGIDYDRHNLQIGLTRRFPKGVVTHLAYGFAQYREPSAGGAPDFSAHSVFAAITLPWH